MGRPRKSIEEHLRNGTYRPDRHGPIPATVATVAAVEPVAENLTRPPSLAGRAAEAWDELVEQMKGIIRRRDIPALVELCRWIERSEKIARDLDDLEPTEPGFKQLLIAAAIATDKIGQLTKQFGMSPADRHRLKVIETGPPKAKVPTRPKTKLDQQGPPR